MKHKIMPIFSWWSTWRAKNFFLGAELRSVDWGSPRRYCLVIYLGFWRLILGVEF